MAGRALPPAARHRGGGALRVPALAGGAAAVGGRGADAGRPVRQAAAPPDRLPRPVGLRAAALARHDRSDAGPDVPGLPADVPAGQRRDDPGGLRPAAGPGLVARAGPADPGDPARRGLLGLRGPVRAGRPPRPGPGRRPDDGRRGERPRHPDRQGLRPPPQPGPGLPRAGRPAARHGTGQGPATRDDLGGHHRRTGTGHRRGARPRHRAGRGRGPVGGHARRVPVDGAGAALAGGVDRLPAGDEPGGRHRDGTVLRGDGRRGGAGRPGHRRHHGHPARRRRAPRPSSTASTCTSAPARPSPWSAARAPARPRSPPSSRACTRRPAAASCWTARTSP